MTHLPLRPGPFPDETIVGYLVRLAYRNGDTDVLAFARRLGMPFSVLSAAATRRFDLAPLAAATRVPARRLEAMAAWPSRPGRLVFNGHGATRAMVSAARRQACPACLAASPHHRAAWDLSLVTVCPVHAVRLLRSCLCKKALGWTHASIGHCVCGADLSRIPAEPVPEWEMGGTREIYRLFGFDDRGAVSGGHRPVDSALSGLDAGGVATLMWQLGWFEAGGRGLPRPLREARRRHDMHAILDAGYRAILNWPVTFHSFLDRQRAKAARRPGRYGARKEFGSVAAWAVGLPCGDGTRDLVLGALASHAGPGGPLPTRSPALPGLLPDGGVVTLRDAARRLGISVAKVKETLGAGRVALGGDNLGKGAPVLVAREGVERLAAAMGDLRDKRALVRELGCGRKVLDALVNGGILVPDPGGTGNRRWSSAAAASLVSSLEDRTVAAPGPGISFPAAVGRLRRAGMSRADAVRALVGPGPAPSSVDRGASGLGRILFPAAAVASLILVPSRDPATLGISAFASATGLKQETAYRLVAAGLVATVESGRAGRRVPCGEIARFGRDYVRPATLQPAEGLPRGWLGRRLVDAGIVPVTGPGVDGGRHWLFRREEAEGWSKGAAPR